MHHTTLSLAAGLAITLSLPLNADVRLPAIFSDNMVLQQNMRVPVWGWASPGETVTVTFAKDTARTVADAKGAWQVKLGVLKPKGAADVLVVAGRNTLVLSNVLVGEVWLCSGQSNMQFPVRQVRDADKELPDAQQYARIRLATVKNVTAVQPQQDAPVAWQICDSNTVAHFSAVGYFFGRELHKHLRVPVGLINSSWGGTPAESWTSREMLNNLDFLTDRLASADLALQRYSPAVASQEWLTAMAAWKTNAAALKLAAKQPPRQPQVWDPYRSPWQPCSLFNAMINPLIPYAFRGVIWYQGEANAGKAGEYATLFPAMISDWRQRWRQGDFPFLFVQLANFMAVQTNPVQQDASWPFLREAQLKTLAFPKTGMASAIDLADPDNPMDIHPKNKQDVGRRLLLAARAVAYNDQLIHSGPIFDAMTVAGATAALTFKHTGTGLMVKNGEPLKGFAIAGSDQQWVWATAVIKDNTVRVSSEKVEKPVAVRYDWANNPIGNLYNKEGLPASPFRTDTWPEHPPKP